MGGVLDEEQPLRCLNPFGIEGQRQASTDPFIHQSTNPGSHNHCIHLCREVVL